MHLLPFDGEKCRLNKNKISGFKKTLAYHPAGHLMVRRAASNMRKDLTCTKVLEIIMQPDPLQRAAVCIVTNHRLQPLQGKCRKSTQGMCHYCTSERDSVSCSCPSRHKSTDTSRHQQLREWRGEHASGAEDKKKEHSALASVVVEHTCKEHQVICCKSCWKDWTHTQHTHTHTQFSH